MPSAVPQLSSSITDDVIRSAIATVSRVDLHPRDMWVPDPLNFQDLLANQDALVAEVRRRLSTLAFSPSRLVHIPKGALAYRRAAVLELPDLCAYEALVGGFSTDLDDQLAACVYSHRLDLDSPQGRGRYRLGPAGWRDWQRAQLAALSSLGSTGGIVEADVASCFDAIRHDLLFPMLADRGISKETLQVLRAMLNAWCFSKGLGLPQGPAASKVLGNFFLSRIDREAAFLSLNYSRFMDDLRVVVEQESQAHEVSLQLHDAVGKAGLMLNATKLKFVPRDEAIRTLQERGDFASVNYWVNDAQKPQIAQGRLQEIVAEALRATPVDDRALRFGLSRLGGLYDHSAVGQILERLPEIPGHASLVTAYLSRFISADSRIAPAILSAAEALEGSRANDYLLSWYLALLQLAAPTIKLVSLARRVAEDRNRASYVRAVAVRVWLSNSETTEIEAALRTLASEKDPYVVRGALTGLAVCGQLKLASKTAWATQPEVVDGTIEFLQGIQEIPGVLRWLGQQFPEARKRADTVSNRAADSTE